MPNLQRPFVNKEHTYYIVIKLPHRKDCCTLAFTVEMRQPSQRKRAAWCVTTYRRTSAMATTRRPVYLRRQLRGLALFSWLSLHMARIATLLPNTLGARTIGVAYCKGSHWATGHAVAEIDSGEKVWLKIDSDANDSFQNSLTTYSGMLIQPKLFRLRKVFFLNFVSRWCSQLGSEDTGLRT